jgi:putative spermidine/putrescine transport system ATP-binding protein
MNAGKVEQFGTPFEIYNRPASRFAATFVGTLNTIGAKVSDAASRAVTIDGQSLTLDRLPEGAKNGDSVALTLRPEAVSLANGAAHDITLDGRVSGVAFLGAVVRLTVDLGENAIDLDVFNDQHRPPPTYDDKVRVAIERRDILILDD